MRKTSVVLVVFLSALVGTSRLRAQGSGDSVDWIAGLCDSGVSCAIGGPIQFDPINVVDGVGITSNNSFLELGGTGGNQIGLLQGCSNNDIPKWVEASSVWNCAVDVSGGTPAWSALINDDAAASFIRTVAGEILTFDDQSAAAADSPMFIIQQTVGNPVAGSVLLEVTAADADPILARIGDTSTAGQVGLLLSMAQPGVAGQRDSHLFEHTGTSFDSVVHDADWNQQVNVTSNAGASTWLLQSRIDAAARTTRLSVTDAGLALGDIFDATTGFRLGGAGTANQVLKGDGTNITLAALVDADLPTTALLESDAGLGTVINAGSIDLDFIDVTDAAGSAGNQSGMEFGGTGAADFGLLRGCTINQILKWDGTALWECQNDEDTNPLDLTACDSLVLDSGGQLTLTGGANSVNCHTVDTFASAASDNWDSTVCTAGSWHSLKALISTRTVVLTTTAGASDTQWQFDHVDDRHMIECPSTNVIKTLNRKSNGV